MNKEFLPIGSVCLLKDAKKKVMITGFCVKGNETGDRVFDYLACVYPEGVISSDQNLLFDHEDIGQIIAIGYSDEEEKQVFGIYRELEKQNRQEEFYGCYDL